MVPIVKRWTVTGISRSGKVLIRKELWYLLEVIVTCWTWLRCSRFRGLVRQEGLFRVYESKAYSLIRNFYVVGFCSSMRSLMRRHINRA
jgi:hypothetical protein